MRFSDEFIGIILVALTFISLCIFGIWGYITIGDLEHNVHHFHRAEFFHSILGLRYLIIDIFILSSLMIVYSLRSVIYQINNGIENIQMAKFSHQFNNKPISAKEINKSIPQIYSEITKFSYDSSKWWVIIGFIAICVIFVYLLVISICINNSNHIDLHIDISTLFSQLYKKLLHYIFTIMFTALLTIVSILLSLKGMPFKFINIQLIDISLSALPILTVLMFFDDAFLISLPYNEHDHYTWEYVRNAIFEYDN